jgi:predicted alpha-1,6-mannanase (GH76 family)
MKKLTCLLAFALSILIISPSQAQKHLKTTKAKAGKASFSAADASLAYSAFNNAFYDTGHKLYYSTTKKDGVAAIWVQAIYWDMALNLYQQKHNADRLTKVTDIYQGNYKHYDAYNWTNHKVWFIYDDMMWWIMALARAHQITGNPEYLQKSKEGFDHVWAGSYDAANGGMFWDFNHSGKNACINFPTAIAAARLYTITGDTAYLNKAKMIYAWSKINLVDASGKVNDNKIGNHPAGGQDYTYNSGTAIGAAVALHKITKDATYLKDAILFTDYVKNILCTNGILPAEGDFNEQGILKAIFAQYVMELITDEHQTQYLGWIRNNINTGWQNRDVARNLTFRDYTVPCPTGDIQSYEASSIVMFMQLWPAGK